MKNLLNEKTTLKKISFTSLESLRLKRVYPYLTYEEEKDLKEIWNNYSLVKNKNDVIKWIKNFRLFVWGEENEWTSLELDKESEEYYKKRIEKLMGNNIFVILSSNSCFKEIFIDYESEESDIFKIIEKIESDSKIRANFLNSYEIPENLNYNNILSFSEYLGKKYALASINISNILCFEDIYLYLKDIDLNFSLIAKLFKIENHQIGLNKLNINIEVEESDLKDYKNINIGINNINGFITDWFKFIDNQCSFLIKNNSSYFFSESIIDIEEENNEYFKFKKIINDKYKNKSISYSILTMRKMLKKLPDIILYMKKYAKNDEESEALNKIAFTIDKFVARYESSISNSFENKKIWNNCKKTCENIVSKYKLNNNTLVFKLWLYAISLTERISFNDNILPNYKLWFILSVFIGRIEDNSKLTERNEMLCRSLNTVVKYKIKKDSWLTNNCINSILTPQEEELILENVWWSENLKVLIEMAT